MNPTDNTTLKLQEVIQKGQSGAVILPNNPSYDAVAAATSVYLALTKLGKNVSLVCDSQPKTDLIANDKIQRELTTAGDNLVISFPYTEGSIDKVDYSIQGEVFNLLVTPRKGYPKLDPEKVNYSYTGGAVDFIITVDSPNLNSLGRIFTENKIQFQGKTIINIDRHLVNDFYGTINIVNKISSSTSELALRFLNDIEAEIDKDIATNLYAGLVTATNTFTSYSVNAETFEVAAALLKKGAVKKQLKKPTPPTSQPPSSPFSQTPSFFPKRQPSSQDSASHQKPFEQQSKQIEDVEDEQKKEGNEPLPDEWLKPKIFRGTGMI